MVVASRYVRGGGTSNFPLGRWLLSRAGCWLARPLTPVRDAMSGFFLIRREHLDGFRTSVSGFKIGLELFVRSRPRRLAEVGYVFVGRTLRPDTLRHASWIAATSQVLVALVPVLLIVVGTLALIAVGILAVVALVVLFTDRR